MLQTKLFYSRKEKLLLIFFLLFFLVNNIGADENKISMKFTEKLCLDMKYDPFVVPDTNTPFGKKWRKAVPKKYSETWMDTKKLKIIKYIHLNCGAEVTKGEFKKHENTLRLTYYWREKLLAMCSCTRKLEFTFNNLEQKKYKILIEPVELPPWMPEHYK